MKATIAFCFYLVTYLLAFSREGEPLTIEKCYLLARKYYPLSKQRTLIEQSKEFTISNISKGYLPQVTFAGQATYQSDVTKIPIKLPGVNIDDPSKDQYKASSEISQLLYDGGVIKRQKELEEINSLVEQQDIEIELYKLKERINQLYFGILLIDAQLDQVQTLQKDIQSGMTKVEGAVKNGAALKSNLDVLKAELLNASERIIELKAGRKAYINMLGLFLHQNLGENTLLQRPAEKNLTSSINRPELKLFDYRVHVFDVQQKLISARNFPKAGIFIQGGYGRPALNLLSNRFSFYSIGGLRVSWPLAGLYTSRNDRRSLSIHRNEVDVQKETFVFNTNLSLQQQHADIDKLQELIKVDQQIILVRESVKNAVNAQLTYGTITSNDYIREVNAEDLARQNLLLHQLQLLMVQYTYQTTGGNG